MTKFKNMIIGAIILAVGIIWGLNALGLTNINIFFDGWWTLFIIIPSLIGLLNDKEKTGNIIGLIIGIALLLCCQDFIDFDLIFKLAIPTILIVIGLSYIFKDILSNKVNEKIKNLNKDNKEYFSAFSGQDLSFEDEFEGCNLTAVFGGIKCDLSKVDLKEDKVINVSAIFGGIDIYVPKNVKVKVASTSIFGGVDNKIKENESDITIYINATCIFGGVDIK